MFYDIGGVFAGDAKPYFIDIVRLTGAGNDSVAPRMLKDIVSIIKQ